MITVDGEQGELILDVTDDVLATRSAAVCSVDSSQGVGRELFALFRRVVTTAEEGATVFFGS